MKNEKLLCRIGYQKDRDSYVLMLSRDDGETWDESCSSVCQRCERDEKDAEPMFVHIGLIEELKKAIAAGWTVVY